MICSFDIMDLKLTDHNDISDYNNISSIDDVRNRNDIQYPLIIVSMSVDYQKQIVITCI